MARRPDPKHLRMLDGLLSRLAAEDAARPDPLSGLTPKARRVAERERSDDPETRFAHYLAEKPFMVVSDFDPTQFGLSRNPTCEELQDKYYAMISDMSGQNNLRAKLKDVFK